MIVSDNFVTIVREQDDGCVDHVRESSGAEKLPHSASERGVKRQDINASERLSQARLPGVAAPRGAVEHKAHADFALRRAGWRRPRTTVACSRSERRWATISSVVISPNSAS